MNAAWTNFRMAVVLGPAGPAGGLLVCTYETSYIYTDRLAKENIIHLAYLSQYIIKSNQICQTDYYFKFL